MTVAILLLVISVTLLVAWLAYEVIRLRSRVDAVPTEGGVFEALRRLDTDLATVEDVVADLGPRLAALEERLPAAISRTAVVTYDAYGDISGRRSRSFALLNERGDGVVISVLVGREETLWYTKEVRGGAGSEELSPEERQAVRRALGTLRR